MANDCHGLGLVCPEVVVSVSQHLKLVLSEAEHFQTKRSQAVSSIQTTGDWTSVLQYCTEPLSWGR